MSLVEDVMPEDTGGPEFTPQTDLVDQAKAKLLEQFKGKDNIEALLEVLVEPSQDIEEAAAAVYEAFDPYTATGHALDVAGWRVGEQRNGRTDTAYRPYVIGRIAANKSDGRALWLYRLIRALIGEDFYTLRAEAMPPASYEMTIGGETALYYPWDITVNRELVASQIADLMLDATSAGISFDLIWLSVIESESFTFADGDTDDVNTLIGFASADSESSGTGGRFPGQTHRE